MMNWKDLEGSGRGIIVRFYLGIRLEGLRKTTNISVRIAGVEAKIGPLGLPNTKQEC
jgi:hypothetical protein